MNGPTSPGFLYSGDQQTSVKDPDSKYLGLFSLCKSLLQLLGSTIAAQSTGKRRSWLCLIKFHLHMPKLALILCAIS